MLILDWEQTEKYKTTKYISKHYSIVFCQKPGSQGRIVTLLKSVVHNVFIKSRFNINDDIRMNFGYTHGIVYTREIIKISSSFCGDVAPRDIRFHPLWLIMNCLPYYEIIWFAWREYWNLWIFRSLSGWMRDCR